MIIKQLVDERKITFQNNNLGHLGNEIEGFESNPKSGCIKLLQNQLWIQSVIYLTGMN